MRRIARQVLVAAAICTAIGSGAAAAPRVNGVILDRPVPVQAFALDDHNGKPFTAESLEGRWSLVLAGYTSCPDVCPFTLANLEQVTAELGLRLPPDRLPAVIFLAVDPDRDRANLKEYVQQFHPDFIGVTGELEQIDRALKGFDAAAVRAKPDAQGNYLVSHSAAVAVVDPRGRLVAKISPPFDPEPTADFLADLFRRHEAASAGRNKEQ
jgi:protein SCO1/2